MASRGANSQEGNYEHSVTAIQCACVRAIAAICGLGVTALLAAVGALGLG